MPKDPLDTPAMRQFRRFKDQHPDKVLLFRMGDFYEMFDDDARRVGEALGLKVVQRTTGLDMAGIPHHQLETYKTRLLDSGFRIVIADQVQDPREAKGVVDRAITEVVTPGTIVGDGVLSDDAVCTLAAVCFVEAGDDSPAAAAVADLSTGSFVVLDGEPGVIADELVRRGVREVLYADTADGNRPARVDRLLRETGAAPTPCPAWHFRPSEALEALKAQFGVTTLDGFGLAPDDPSIQPAGAVVRYLRHTQALDEQATRAETPLRPTPTLAHLRPPRREDPRERLVIDATSLRALEVLTTLRGGGVHGSLLSVFLADRHAGCRSPMGRRLLREWLVAPLRDPDSIRARQDAVATLAEDTTLADELSETIAGVRDVARIGARLALRRASPRDLVSLGASLARAGELARALENAPALRPHRRRLSDLKPEVAPLAERIASACVDEPPGRLSEGGLIRDGFDAELDEARALKRDASSYLADLQARLIEEHDLPSLRVGFNRVFGYYIELPAAQSRRAPDTFTRKQTLKNAERFITPELKDFEDRITSAESRALEREAILFGELVAAAAGSVDTILRFADVVAEIDVLRCFAGKVSRFRGSGREWTRPEIVEEPTLRIRQGRHPVLDDLLEGEFVPNDVALGPLPEHRRGDLSDELDDPDAPHLALITGPNMAGKSTFIRQAALITILAHSGSFVPAQSAIVGLTDRVFTRVGADDALHAGQSTFMVEMTETARILNHASDRGLVILDEIGRGTSTLDGLSLAWAIAECLAGENRSGLAPRTLFATHYHELTDLEDRMPGRVQNLHVQVREWGADIVFMRRIAPGRTSNSYGVHVARLAGVPSHVIDRAGEVLSALTVQHSPVETDPVPPPAGEREGQLALFTEFAPHPAVDELKELKIDTISPLDAFELLRKLKDMAAP